MTCNDCGNYGLCQTGKLSPFNTTNAECCQDFISNKKMANLFIAMGKTAYVVRNGKVYKERIENVENVFKNDAYHTEFQTTNGTYNESDIGKSVFLRRLDAQISTKLAVS